MVDENRIFGSNPKFLVCHKTTQKVQFVSALKLIPVLSLSYISLVRIPVVVNSLESRWDANQFKLIIPDDSNIMKYELLLKSNPL